MNKESTKEQLIEVIGKYEKLLKDAALFMKRAKYTDSKDAQSGLRFANIIARVTAEYDHLLHQSREGDNQIGMEYEPQ